MEYTTFTAAMAQEVRRQAGEGFYYGIATAEEPLAGESVCHIETETFRPGNAAHDSYSVAKSVSSMAAGLMYDRGLLKMTDTIGQHLGEYFVEGTDPRWKDVTIHQLMRHRTGAAYGTDFDDTNAHLWSDPEWLHTLFAAPIISEREDRFVYSDGSYYILGRIVEKLAGMDMEALLQREVFVPLGFHVNAWSRDVNGHTVGGTGLYIRTEDLAKIGWLWLREGMWGERRIYSKAWSDIFLGYEGDAVANYGYGISRIADGVYMAGGAYGQGVCMDTVTKRVVAWHCYDNQGKTAGLGGAMVRFCR